MRSRATTTAGSPLHDMREQFLRLLERGELFVGEDD